MGQVAEVICVPPVPKEESFFSLDRNDLRLFKQGIRIHHRYQLITFGPLRACSSYLSEATFPFIKIFSSHLRSIVRAQSNQAPPQLLTRNNKGNVSATIPNFIFASVDLVQILFDVSQGGQVKCTHPPSPPPLFPLPAEVRELLSKYLFGTGVNY